MKRIYLVSLGAVIIAGAFLFSQENETELGRVSKQIEALRKEVSFLANQVELLKKDLSDLRSQRAPAPPGIPLGAAEKEINGVKYYIVPVKDDPAGKQP